MALGRRTCPHVADLAWNILTLSVCGRGARALKLPPPVRHCPIRRCAMPSRTGACSYSRLSAFDNPPCLASGARRRRCRAPSHRLASRQARAEERLGFGVWGDGCSVQEGSGRAQLQSALDDAGAQVGAGHCGRRPWQLHRHVVLVQWSAPSSWPDRPDIELCFHVVAISVIFAISRLLRHATVSRQGVRGHVWTALVRHTAIKA